MVAQAMGGIMSITGHPGGPPTRVGSSIGDLAAGLFTAIGVNAALLHRERTGEAMKIDVAMLDSQVAILENAITRYCATGVSPGPLGARHPTIAPFAAFATADGHIIIAAGNNGLFDKMCQAIGAPDIAARPEFASNELRTQNHLALKAAVEVALAKGNCADWLARLDAAGVPCGPLNNVEQALDDPQVRFRNMVVSMQDDAAGELKMAGNPMKFSGFADPATRGRAPDLDADRQHILAELDAKG
jgi:CoA:oxalate CoA-transferase